MKLQQRSLMTTVTALAALAVSAGVICACQKQAEPEPAAGPAVTAESSFEDKSAYAVGASVGTYLNRMQQAQAEFVGPLQGDLIVSGFVDAMHGKSALDDKAIEDTLRELDKKVQEAMTVKAKEVAAENLAAGKKFLEENAHKEGVQTTASGLQYKVLTPGEGEAPKKGETISVTYRGTTIDGQVFDEQKNPVDFDLDNMIPGWVEGLQLMKPGAEYELYLPAELAYGENGAGDTIKPNSVLIFNVKLHAVKPPVKAPDADAPTEQDGGADRPATGAGEGKAAP